MKSGRHGTDTSEPEVVNISSHGFWLFVSGKEYFLDYDRFPWFRNATVAQISKVESAFGRIFRWPELDVDLDTERIEHPEKFPLAAKNANADP